jgi:hypothetical protein
MQSSARPGGKDLNLSNERDRIPQGINLKILIVGAGAVALACFMSIHALVDSATKLSSDWFPFAAAILFVFVLFFVNPVLRILDGGWELNRGELLLVFVLLFCGVSMSTSGFAYGFVSNLATPFFHATDGNQWREKLIQYLPLWLYPSGYEPVEWFWRGRPEGAPIPYAAWFAPFLHWLILAAAMYGAMAAIVSIMRKQWVENERLNFPLMEVPCALTEGFERGLRIPPVLRNRLFWIGFFVTAALYSTHILNGLSPAFPKANFIGKDILGIRPSENWGIFRIHLLPVLVGFGFLVNRDILLSIWIFGVFAYFEKSMMKVFGYSAGTAFLQEDSGSPALAFQSVGAVFVYVVAGLYMARNHLKTVFRNALSWGGALDDSQEAMRSRSSVLLLILSLLTAWAFCMKMGMTPGVAASLLCVVFVLALAATRFIIEAGFLLYSLPASAVGVVIALHGTAGFTGACFGAIVAFVALGIGASTGGMPALANAMKLGDGRSIKNSAIMQAAVIGMAIGAAVSLWATLRYGYGDGAINCAAGGFRDSGKGVITKMIYARENMLFPSEVRMVWGAVGAGVMTVLTICRYTFSWWPIHPIGFAVCTGLGIQFSVFAFFIAWTAKTILLRVGGVPLYSKAKPFFYGLLLGHIGIIFVGWIVDTIKGPPGVNLYW